jgi:hypothetical protein
MFNRTIGDGPIMDIPADIGGPEPGPDGHIRASDRGGVALYIQVRDLAAPRGVERQPAPALPAQRPRGSRPSGSSTTRGSDPGTCRR